MAIGTKLIFRFDW